MVRAEMRSLLVPSVLLDRSDCLADQSTAFNASTCGPSAHDALHAGITVRGRLRIAARDRIRLQVAASTGVETVATRFLQRGRSLAQAGRLVLVRLSAQAVSALMLVALLRFGRPLFACRPGCRHARNRQRNRAKAVQVLHAVSDRWRCRD